MQARCPNTACGRCQLDASEVSDNNTAVQYGYSPAAYLIASKATVKPTMDSPILPPTLWPILGKTTVHKGTLPTLRIMIRKMAIVFNICIGTSSHEGLGGMVPLFGNDTNATFSGVAVRGTYDLSQW